MQIDGYTFERLRGNCPLKSDGECSVNVCSIRTCPFVFWLNTYDKLVNKEKEKENV